MRLKTLLQMVALLVLLAVLLTSCGSPLYYLAPIDASVVDETTGQPLEGVHVIAHWELVRGSLDGSRAAGQLGVKEAVTDRSGRFHIDGFVGVNPLLKELRGADPRLIFFKPGYEVQFVANTYGKANTDTPGMRRMSQFNGRTLKMPKFTSPGEGKAPLTFHTALAVETRRILDGTCNWRKLPRAILAMDGEAKRLKAQYPAALVGVPSIDDIDQMASIWCGSVKNHFGSVKP